MLLSTEHIDVALHWSEDAISCCIWMWCS